MNLLLKLYGTLVIIGFLAIVLWNIWFGKYHW